MAQVNPPLIGVGQHPRAASAIRRTKAVVSLFGFTAAGLGSWWHGVPMEDAAIRGLCGAAAGYLAGWFVAITIWRSMLEAEARLAVERAIDLRQRERERSRAD
jgi:apolipoprotein N-acyltransferase